MCGFVISINEGSREEVAEATSTFKYRGPDDTNYFFLEEEKIYIGHNRLAVMEPEQGKQPLSTEDKQIIILFNGEIYNQFELRKELIEKNIIFKTKSLDTEVILKGYLIWGAEIFNKLDGQFAITIIDRRKRKVFLARDKFGEKPLFYFLDNKFLVVASDLKAFPKFKKIDLSINKLSLMKYFIYSFIPSPLTIYKNIYKVKNSCYIEINYPNFTIKNTEYYIPKINKNYRSSESDLVEELDELLSQSVKSRLISDSKIGSFLSGGLDSSLITYYAKQEKKDFKTYNISIKEESFDELERAKKISNYLSLDLYSCELDQNEFIKIYNKILIDMDEPIGAPTMIPMYFLSKFAKQNLKSVLCGDGADEMFGGYDNFKYINIIEKINNLKINKYFNCLSFISEFLKFSKKNLSLDFKLRRFFQGISFEKKYQNTMFLSPINLDDLSDLFNEKINVEEVLSEVKEFDKKFNNINFFEKNYLYFLYFYIPDLICSRADKAGMLNSLEIRSPFLNHKILEFSLSFPENKQYLLKDKLILRMLASKKISKDFMNLKKGGFTFPMQKWLTPIQYETNFLNNNIIQKMQESHTNEKREYRNFFHCLNAVNKFI